MSQAKKIMRIPEKKTKGRLFFRLFHRNLRGLKTLPASIDNIPVTLECLHVLVTALVFGVIVIGGAFIVKYVGTMVLQVSGNFLNYQFLPFFTDSQDELERYFIADF